MELIFTILLSVFVVLVYLANRENKVNKWCALMGLVFLSGVFKEAVLYNIIPLAESALQNYSLHEDFMPVYSVLTWVLYSLAMPTALLFAVRFNGINNPVLMGRLKLAVYFPALLLSLFFPPLSFRAYQLGILPFWVSYSIYNLTFCAVYTVFMLRGVFAEAPGKARTQKKYVCIVLLPPIFFWALSVFLTHPFGLTSLFKLWQGNALIVLISIFVFVFMAFRDGMMGLRLTKESYSWNSDMDIINRGATYTEHMLKNQTSKMEWCIENLKTGYSGEPPEELAILSRSVAALKAHIDKVKKYSNSIHLIEEPCRLKTLVENAASSFATKISISIDDDVFWVCDKIHMTEVFNNILSNAVEASNDLSAIEVFENKKPKTCYSLVFQDHGSGMGDENVKKMFLPYFTTKNTERNFGLGLSYSKNVVEKHGGSITAESKPGVGTAVTIMFPMEKTSMDGMRLMQDEPNG